MEASGGSGGPALNTYAIQQAVAKEWGVTTEGLRSKTRTKNLTVPRQVAMHLMRELLGMQLVEIGAAFGGRDHSTVIHSLERVAAMMKEDPSFAQRVGKDPGRVGKPAELNMDRSIFHSESSAPRPIEPRSLVDDRHSPQIIHTLGYSRTS